MALSSAPCKVHFCLLGSRDLSKLDEYYLWWTGSSIWTGRIQPFVLDIYKLTQLASLFDSFSISPRSRLENDSNSFHSFYLWNRVAPQRIFLLALHSLSRFLQTISTVLSILFSIHCSKKSENSLKESEEIPEMLSSSLSTVHAITCPWLPITTVCWRFLIGATLLSFSLLESSSSTTFGSITECEICSTFCRAEATFSF